MVGKKSNCKLFSKIWRGGNSSDYAKQMRAKQTLKGYYGNVGEKKFRAYYMEELDVLIGILHKFGIDLIGRERRHTFGAFFFKSHADPDVGVDVIGIFPFFSG